MASRLGKNFIHLKQCSSTNSYLSELLSNSEPIEEGSVIMAVHQTEGRGQMGKRWESEEGKNLTFSLLLKPIFMEPGQQFFLSMAVALGLAQYIKSKGGNKVKVKWPNDVYVGQKKIAGILIENQMQGLVIENSIVGIGLNVNQDDFGEWQGSRCSLLELLYKEQNLLEVLSDLLDFIDQYYELLQKKDFALIEQQYLNNLMYLNETRSYLIKGTEVQGKIVGIGKHGELELIVRNELLSLSNHEISYLH